MGLLQLIVSSLMLVSAHAQFVLNNLPACAADCAVQVFPQSSCSSTDYLCMCTDVPLLRSLEVCVSLNCTIREALSAKNQTTTACHIPSRDDSRTMAQIAPTFAALSLVFVIIRLIARWNMLGSADLCISAAWFTGLAAAVVNTMMVSHGLGKDVWTVPFADIDYLLYLLYASAPLYLASTILCKIGICLFLLRIFPLRSFQITIWIIVALCATTGIVFASALIAQCTPIPYSWLFWDGEHQGSCIHRNAGTWAHAVMNIVLDIMILAAPLVQFWILKTSYSLRKKIAIGVMFSVGGIVSIVSMFRLRSLVAFMASHNFTYYNLGTAQWSLVEMHVGIICACLPAARVFFGRIVPKLLGVTNNDSRATQPQYVDPRLHNRRTVPTETGSWSRITTIGNNTHVSYSPKDFGNFVRLDEISQARAVASPMGQRKKSEV